MNAPFAPIPIALDELPQGSAAIVAAIDWAHLGEHDTLRMRQFGFDEGVQVEVLHYGPVGRDPIAIRVGRMTVAIRRRHAAAVRVVPKTL